MIDHAATLVRTVVFEKVPDGRHGRNLARDVQRHATEEFGIVCERGRGHSCGLPAAAKMFVDPFGQCGDVVGRFRSDRGA